jgi:hypothetical protein
MIIIPNPKKQLIGLKHKEKIEQRKIDKHCIILAIT